jgi:beta-lactamase class D
MKGTEGTFVFLDVKNQTRLVYDKKRAERRFSPYSTFKIPHTLIALETGVAAGPGAEIKWDQEKYPKEEWWDTTLKPRGIIWDQDHTLSSAFANSCVWYYKETAKKIGAEKMQEMVDKFNYGNRDISSAIDSFWLGESLEISAAEQVDFLEKIVKKELPLKEKTYTDGLAVFKRDSRDGKTLYAKTGGGKDIGWFVGFITDNDNSYIFAFNMPGTFEQTADRKIEVPAKILHELKVWQ